MVSSVDGAAASDGLSAGLQTPGDNRIFAVLRDLADVVVVGAATAQAEGYRPVVFDPARSAVRRDYGFAPGLPIALVSRRLGLDINAPLFRDPARRPLVITLAQADATPLAGLADVLVCGTEFIDFAEARRQLAARGLTRVLCEGGPTLLGRMIAAQVLDELCLSFSPLLAGPGATRIVAGSTFDPTTMQLTGLLEDDGALFLRYSLDRAATRATMTP